MRKIVLILDNALYIDPFNVASKRKTKDFTQSKINLFIKFTLYNTVINKAILD